MHGLGSWSHGAGNVHRPWDRFTFLGVSLLVTLVLLGSGLASLRSAESAWFGVFLVFCALTLAYAMPPLQASLAAYLGAAPPQT